MQVRDTDSDWAEIGKTEPYYGVLTDPRFKLANLTPAALEEFYRGGEDNVRQVFEIIRSHLIPSFRPTSALDFGCGVGRMLIPLGRRCDKAYGVDISERMLELCSQRLRIESITNVTLVKSDDALSDIPAEYDLLTSVIVFQHIPPRRGYGLLRRLLEHLAPSGALYLQLTFAKDRRFLEHASSHMDLYRVDESGLTVLAESPQQNAPIISMYDYDLNVVFAILSRAGIDKMLVSSTDHGGCHGVTISGRKGSK